MGAVPRGTRLDLLLSQETQREPVDLILGLEEEI